MKKSILLLLIISTVFCECVAFSSFWAPLFNPKLLNYKVDLKFDPDEAKTVREEYAIKHGFRGEMLIANLGNGRGPGLSTDSKAYGDVKFHYTYPGATKGISPST